MISENRPGLLAAMLDSSTSMARHMNLVAHQFNSSIHDLLMSVPRRDGVPRNILRVAAVEFGAGVGPAWGGNLAGRDLVTLQELEENYLEVEKPARGEDAADRPVWFMPKAECGTPLLEALEFANELTDRFLARYPDSDTPTWMVFTDGQHTTGDPSPAAMTLRSKATVFYVYLDTSTPNPKPVLFPSVPVNDEFGSKLFSFASELPEHVIPMAQAIVGESVPIGPGARAFATSVPPRLISRLFEIGTYTQIACP